jgi:hypothetical protein
MFEARFPTDRAFFLNDNEREENGEEKEEAKAQEGQKTGDVEPEPFYTSCR